jgi:hypothetical protein
MLQGCLSRPSVPKDAGLNVAATTALQSLLTFFAFFFPSLYSPFKSQVLPPTPPSSSLRTPFSSAAATAIILSPRSSLFFLPGRRRRRRCTDGGAIAAPATATNACVWYTCTVQCSEAGGDGGGGGGGNAAWPTAAETATAEGGSQGEREREHAGATVGAQERELFFNVQGGERKPVSQ